MTQKHTLEELVGGAGEPANKVNAMPNRNVFTVSLTHRFHFVFIDQDF